MRIAYLVSQYPAVNHTFILREIRSLRDQGFSIDVVSVRSPDRSPEQLSIEERAELKYVYSILGAGFSAMFFAQVKTLIQSPLGYFQGLFTALSMSRWNLRLLFFYLAYFLEAVVCGVRLRSLGIKHLHSHFSSTVAFLVGRIFPITYSLTIHGPEEFNDVIGFHMAEKVASAKFVSTISSYSKSQVMKASDPVHWAKIQIARLGVDTAKFASRGDPADSDRFEIVSVGRLAPAKAHQMLITAVGDLVDHGHRAVHLRIIGEGAARSQLEAVISRLHLEQYVTLEGACNQDRVMSFYEMADLFVLASFAEGVPVVLMEAMAMEIPCIATWITGVPELIEHNVSGWLVPPGDHVTLQDGIEKLMGDSKLRLRLGTGGRLQVQLHYELSENVAELANIFRASLQTVSSRARQGHEYE